MRQESELGESRLEASESNSILVRPLQVLDECLFSSLQDVVEWSEGIRSVENESVVIVYYA